MYTDTVTCIVTTLANESQFLESILETLLDKPYLEPEPLPRYSFEVGGAPILIDLGQAVDPQAGTRISSDVQVKVNLGATEGLLESTGT